VPRAQCPFSVLVYSLMHSHASEFRRALSWIEIKDDRRAHAIAAHTEIREFLEADTTLQAWGVQTALIGSYARHTGIWPGKDVDVFTKLRKLSVGSTDPRTVYDHTREILVAAYGDRAEPQNRSVKIGFDRDGFEFSVDVVPAVRWGRRWAIPRRDTTTWDEADERRWVETDPERLEALTERLNDRLKIAGQGAYVPVVKLVRQARSHHRDKQKPGGFYFELLTYWAFVEGQVSGTSFAQVFGVTLGAIAAELRGVSPLKDPVLDRDYRPQPDPHDRAEAGRVMAGLADKAREAVTTDDICKSAARWREILGQNDKGWCFPVPDGCDEHGRKLPVAAPAVSRGSREAGPFAGIEGAWCPRLKSRP
jgi:Second Messenger Oligonucleotide or Dinucleotide Synthetase domain